MRYDSPFTFLNRDVMTERAIICVDDDLSILSSLEDRLKHNFGNDCEIKLTSSGIKALDLCHELIASGVEIPLIICDRNMPEMSGDNLLIELHRCYPQTLKILLSEQTDVDRIGNIINTDALYRYLTKPWNEIDLILTVREALRSYEQNRQIAAQQELLIETNEKLAESLSLLVATLEVTADGILVLDNHGEVVRYNQKFIDLLAISEEIEQGEILAIARNQLIDRDRLLFVQQNSDGTSLLELKNGKILECYCQMQQLQQRQIGRVWSFHDITQRYKTEAIVRHQAFHDTLTDLPNRTLFNIYLTEALENATLTSHPLAVIFLDVDRFKTINDTLGHAMGDRLLQNIVKRLLGCIRDKDVVARWGGDEFTLLLPNINCREDATAIAQRLLAALRPPFELDEHCFYITSSIGIALYPDDGRDSETLLKNADAALYKAKEGGRNDYRHYNLQINSQAKEKLALENKLYSALEKREFVLYYQPIVDVTTGKILKMEALVRWQHPQLGLVPPNLFIPLAEENGAIVPIGKWVLETACAQTMIWQNMGFESLAISVNLSVRQFQQRNLVFTIADILKQTQLSPASLELEITETVMMQDTELVKTTLLELDRLGVNLAMDDFGTGYSSLSYLKIFPFNTLKIDRFFIKNVLENSEDAAIVNAIINLGKGLNVKVVAEGVETEELKNLLQSWQCEYMQGYWFGKPVSAEEATELLV
jgi:diguanylate cyclase (GGDEF)-like protein